MKIEAGMLCEIVLPDAIRNERARCRACGTVVLGAQFHGLLVTTVRAYADDAGMWSCQMDDPVCCHEEIDCHETWLRPLPPPPLEWTDTTTLEKPIPGFW